MKAIIPVAGAGTKLRPHTYTQPKALIPMAGKTILSVIVDQLVAVGIEEFVFITGYLGDKIKDYIQKYYPSLKASYVIQHDRKGTGHAIALTKEVVGSDEVMIVYGDTICEFDLEPVIKSDQSVICVRKVDDPRNFGVAEVNNDNVITRVVEKPAIPKSNMAMVGMYKIKESAILFDVLDTMLRQNASNDGEYHFTKAIQNMIDQGVTFEAHKVKKWFDCGKKETLLETNHTLLKTLHAEGKLVYDEYENSVIIPPVNIAPGCEIKNSIIGPSVSIGENTKIDSSIIKDSIIGAFAVLDEVVLKSSFIGNDTYIHGITQSLNIGDNTEIDLS